MTMKGDFSMIARDTGSMWIDDLRDHRRYRLADMLAHFVKAADDIVEIREVILLLCHKYLR